MYLILIFQKTFLVFAWCILCIIILELCGFLINVSSEPSIPWFITPPAHQFIISKVYLVLLIYLFAVWESLTFIRWLWFIYIDYNHRYIWTYTIIKYVCFFNSPAVASFLVICMFKFFSTNVEYMCASPWFVYTHRALQSASQF